MRAALGTAVMALCFLSQPALAGSGVAPRGSASRQSQSTGGVAPRHVGATSQVLRARLAASSVYEPHGLFSDTAHMRQRLRSSMFEFYPSGDGFHIGAGIKMFERVNLMGDSQRISHGLIYNPRGQGDEGPRSGYRGYQPAVTMGYTRQIGQALTLGVEGGAMLTHANNTMPRSFRLASTGSTRDSSGFNPVANMVVGVHF